MQILLIEIYLYLFTRTRTLPSSSTVISPSLSQSKSLNASLRHSMSCRDSCLSGLSRSVFLVIFTSLHFTTLHWPLLFLRVPDTRSSTTPRITIMDVSSWGQATKLTTTESRVSPWARPRPGWPCWPAASHSSQESWRDNKVWTLQNQNKIISPCEGLIINNLLMSIQINIFSASIENKKFIWSPLATLHYIVIPL